MKTAQLTHHDLRHKLTPSTRHRSDRAAVKPVCAVSRTKHEAENVKRRRTRRSSRMHRQRTTLGESQASHSHYMHTMYKMHKCTKMHKMHNMHNMRKTHKMQRKRIDCPFESQALLTKKRIAGDLSTR